MKSFPKKNIPYIIIQLYAGVITILNFTIREMAVTQLRCSSKSPCGVWDAEWTFTAAVSVELNFCKGLSNPKFGPTPTQQMVLYRLPKLPAKEKNASFTWFR